MSYKTQNQHSLLSGRIKSLIGKELKWQFKTLEMSKAEATFIQGSNANEATWQGALDNKRYNIIASATIQYY